LCEPCLSLSSLVSLLLFACEEEMRPSLARFLGAILLQ
jgi:hypothetical protein